MNSTPFEDVNKMNLTFVDKYEIIGSVRVLRLKGTLDNEMASGVIKLKKWLEKKTDINAMNLLIDLKKAAYGDTSALGVLILRLSELRQRGKKVGLLNASEEMINLLSIFKVEDYFLVFESEEDALKSLG